MEMEIDSMYEFHEAAEIFPLDEEHIGELAKDIRTNGQRVPIELLDGKIIDGRRRYKACRLAGIEPKYRNVTEIDPVAYVLSLNIHRRQLSETQRAMVGARAEKLIMKLKEEAKERQRAAGGDKKSKDVKSVPVNVPEPIHGGDTRDKIGETVGVSGRSIDYARKVLATENPKLIDACDKDKIAVSTAARAATKGEEEQNEIADEAASKTRKRRVKDDQPFVPTGPDGERKLLGKGVFLAHEAINSLSRIPKNDALRKQGFRLVMDWIKRNQ